MSHKVNLSNCSLFCVIKVVTKDFWIAEDLPFDSREQFNAIRWYSLYMRSERNSCQTSQPVKIHVNVMCQGRKRTVLGKQKVRVKAPYSPLSPSQPLLSQNLYEPEVTLVLSSCNLVSGRAEVYVIMVNLFFLPNCFRPSWLISAMWDRGAGFSNILNSYQFRESRNLERERGSTQHHHWGVGRQNSGASLIVSILQT